MRRLMAGLSAILFAGPVLAASDTAGPAWNWRAGTLPDGVNFARANIEMKMLTVKCAGAVAGGHELVYEVPTRFLTKDFVNLKLKQADIVLWVDGHGGMANDKVISAKATVSTYLGSHLFTLSGQGAWDFQGWLLLSDWATIAVNPDYAASQIKNYAVTNNRAAGMAETELGPVLAQGPPKQGRRSG